MQTLSHYSWIQIILIFIYAWSALCVLAYYFHVFRKHEGMYVSSILLALFYAFAPVLNTIRAYAFLYNISQDTTEAGRVHGLLYKGIKKTGSVWGDYAIFYAQENLIIRGTYVAISRIKRLLRKVDVEIFTFEKTGDPK